jgi:hypothetical protein
MSTEPQPSKLTNYSDGVSYNLGNMKKYQTNYSDLSNNSVEIHQTSNTNIYDNNNNINYRFTGPNVIGYRELPTVYDGYAYDINQWQITQNTIYITGVILCSSLLIVGVMLGSSRE